METIQNLQGSTQLSKFDYTYNHVGTIATWTQQADSGTAIVNTLSYDAADQLTRAVQSGEGKRDRHLLGLTVIESQPAEIEIRQANSHYSPRLSC